jgi:ABC-type branched-subunit amino acid transport system substrate-binding protein
LNLVGRRSLIVDAVAAGAGIALPWASYAKPDPGARNLSVVQVVDTSSGQQDVSKDFLIGSRAAWQDINTRGGIRGRRIQHQTVEFDGTPDALAEVLKSVRDDPGCLALSGTAGNTAATLVAAQLRRDRMGWAHVAPWLQSASVDIDEQTFPIFAGRQEQIAHALRNLSAMGVTEVGAVFASGIDMARNRTELESIAAALKLTLKPYAPSASDNELTQLGLRLPAAAPAILLFLGGTPELAQFTQGVGKQTRQRYVVALADVNLQTVLQMGALRNTPIIATQCVPVVTSSQPIVRSYREVMSRLFDEPPAPLSLAGFIAARFTFEVLNEIEGVPSRASVLAAFQRRTQRSIGGFPVSFDAQRRSAGYVTQSMVTSDGRVVG